MYNRNNTKKYDDRTKGRNTSRVVEKIKMVNQDAIMRSEFHNMIVDEMDFSIPSGEYIKINGNQLLYYTLTPGKPLIDCPYIQLKMTYDNSINKTDECITRLCTFNKTLPEICSATTEKISNRMCIGRKSHVSSLEFWIVNNAYVNINGEEKDNKIIFVNKNYNTFHKEVFRPHEDTDKAKSLYNLYNAIKIGNIKVASIPKPGNQLFYTLFSGEVEVDIKTITSTEGEQIKGIVKGYELTPGGIPSLYVWMENKLRVIPFYAVSFMIVNKYKANDLLTLRTLELLRKGHIVIPHRGNNTIYDYCNRYKFDKDQQIKLDCQIIPYNQLDKHDIEIHNIINNIK